MNEEKVRQIADAADLIVRGYAFTRTNNLIRVFNTNDGLSAMVMDADGIMLESNMDEIEQALVMSIWQRDSKNMED